MMSNHQNIQCGIPQGSVLGPLLFSIYINNIVNVSKILFFLLFADDTNVFLSGKNINKMIDSLNIELIKLVEWLHANKLSLNIDKTHFIVFTLKKNCVQQVYLLIIFLSKEYHLQNF